MIFDSTVAGIPCKVEVTHYYAGTDYEINSASLEDNDPEEMEYNILHYRTGKPNTWLEGKISDTDDERIFREFKQLLDEEKYDY